MTIPSPGLANLISSPGLSVETKELLFDYSLSDNMDIRETFFPLDMSGQSFVDGYHVNAISKSNDRIALSVRHAHTVLCVHRKTNETLWRLGGKHSDFQFEPPSAHFRWQHDARLYNVNGEDYVR